MAILEIPPMGRGSGGVTGVSRSFVLEVAKKGVTVNVVIPGFVRTRMTVKVDQRNVENILSQVPMGRSAEPEEIASMVTYLVDRHTYITRQVFMVNRGRV